ncbi:MAG: glycine zipper domain-containing protein [Phycisphaerales bacterium]
MTRKTNKRALMRTTAAAGLSTLILLGAAGCNNAGEGAVSGATLGALGGLAIGSLSGDAGKGAVIGAVAGGVGGAVIGDQNERNSTKHYDY